MPNSIYINMLNYKRLKKECKRTQRSSQDKSKKFLFKNTSVKEKIKTEIDKTDVQSFFQSV